MTTHWIANPANWHALVDGDDELATWTLLRGWHEASEPAPDNQTYVRNAAAGLTGCIPYSALAAGWADAGWEPGPPPIPTDPTRPPQGPVEEPRPPRGHGTPKAKTDASDSKEK